jgi:hypothetical protein
MQGINYHSDFVDILVQQPFFSFFIGTIISSSRRFEYFRNSMEEICQSYEVPVHQLENMSQSYPGCLSIRTHICFNGAIINLESRPSFFNVEKNQKYQKSKKKRNPTTKPSHQ